MSDIEIIRTQYLGPKSWIAETSQGGEVITRGGKTEKAALYSLAEHLANPELAGRLDDYRREREKLLEMAENPDCSDKELLEQRQRVAKARRKLRG